MKEFNSNSSPISQIIGVGMRRYEGSYHPVTMFHPWKRNQILKVFDTYPIFETYGLSVDAAMNLPFDVWQDIVASAERIGPKKDKEKDKEL